MPRVMMDAIPDDAVLLHRTSGEATIDGMSMFQTYRKALVVSVSQHLWDDEGRLKVSEDELKQSLYEAVVEGIERDD